MLPKTLIRYRPNMDVFAVNWIKIYVAVNCSKGTFTMMFLDLLKSFILTLSCVKRLVSSKCLHKLSNEVIKTYFARFCSIFIVSHLSWIGRFQNCLALPMLYKNCFLILIQKIKCRLFFGEMDQSIWKIRSRPNALK